MTEFKRHRMDEGEEQQYTKEKKSKPSWGFQDAPQRITVVIPKRTMRILYVGFDTRRADTRKVREAIVAATERYLDGHPDESVNEWAPLTFDVHNLQSILASYLKDAIQQSITIHKSAVIPNRESPVTLADEIVMFQGLRVGDLSISDMIATTFWLMHKFEDEYLKKPLMKVASGKETLTLAKFHAFIMPGQLSNSPQVSLIMKAYKGSTLDASDIETVLTRDVLFKAAHAWRDYEDDGEPLATPQTITAQDGVIIASLKTYFNAPEQQQKNDRDRAWENSKAQHPARMFGRDIMGEKYWTWTGKQEQYTKDKAIKEAKFLFPQNPTLIDYLSRCLSGGAAKPEDLLMLPRIGDLKNSAISWSLMPFLFAALIAEYKKAARIWYYNPFLIEPPFGERKEWKISNARLTALGAIWDDQQIAELLERHPKVELMRVAQIKGIKATRNIDKEPQIRSGDSSETRMADSTLGLVYSFLARYQHNPMMHAYTACKYCS